MIQNQLFNKLKNNFMAINTKKSTPQLWQPYRFIPLLLILITTSLYWQVQNFDFINYDDNEYVYDNPHIQEGITVDSIIWAFTNWHSSNWHPLTWLSHMLDYQMFGLWAGGHHLINLLFHITNSILLFYMFRKMTGNMWQSAFVAVLFALHPLHIQSVAWISERKDVLSTFFWMLTIWAYIRYVRYQGWTIYVCVVFFFTLGLMSKPMVLTLPFVLLLFDFWPLDRLRLDGSKKNRQMKVTGLLLEKIPLFILTVISGGITIFAQQRGGAMKSFDFIPLTDRLANALISYTDYIIKFIFPLKLSIFYPYPDEIHIYKLTGSCIFLSVLSFAAIMLTKRKPWFIVGWLFFLGTLVPVIGLIQVGIQSMADRYMYLPIIGLLIPLAWGIPELLSKWQYRKTILSISAILVIFSSFWISKIQLSFWADTLTLFKRAITVTTNNSFAHNVVGKEFAIKGDYKAAEQYLLTALKIKPDDFDAIHGLGELAYQNNNFNKALNYYQKAVLLRPDDTKIIYIIGDLLHKIGDSKKAILYYSKALAINPSDPEIYNKIGIVLFSQHALDEAQKKFETAVRLNPKFDEAYYNLGLVASKQGKYNEAIVNYKKAINLNPDYGTAHKSLADIMFSAGDMVQAFKHYSEALRIHPDDAATHYNIGVILFQQQQIKAADEHFYTAVKIDLTYEKAKIALSMTRNILGIRNIEKREINQTTP